MILCSYEKLALSVNCMFIFFISMKFTKLQTILFSFLSTLRTLSSHRASFVFMCKKKEGKKIHFGIGSCYIVLPSLELAL